MLGLNRSWKLSAAARRRARHTSRMRARRGEVLAHRFLDEHCRTRRQAAEHAENLIARHGDVEHRAADGARIVERREHRVDAEQLRRDLRRVAAEVEHARDRISKPSVRRQVCGADDGARADDHDRARVASPAARPAGARSWKVEHRLHDRPPFARRRVGAPAPAAISSGAPTPGRAGWRPDVWRRPGGSRGRRSTRAP